MRKEQFYRDKKAVKRSVSGICLALFLALQITGCSQTADQDKAAQKTEQAQGTEKEGAGLRRAAQKLRKTAPEPGKQAGSSPRAAARQMQRRQQARGTA